MGAALKHRKGSRATNSVVIEETKTVRLKCKHDAPSAVSIVTYPDGRKGYVCPEGCGIQRAVRTLAARTS